MNNRELAKTISEISEKELGLLYYFPGEIEKALNEDRFLVFRENEKIAAFGGWTLRKDWLEIHTLYIYPEFRGKGYLRKLFQGIYERLKDGEINTAYFFTQAPAVAHVAVEYGFKKAPYFNLPKGVFWKIFVQRLHPRRLISYLKYVPHITKLFQFNVFIRRVGGG